MRGNLQEVCSLMQRLLDHLVLLYVQLHDCLLKIPAVQIQYRYSTDTVQQYSVPHAAVYQLGAAAARAAAEVVQLHQRRGEAAAGGVQRASRTSSYHHDNTSYDIVYCPEIFSILSSPVAPPPITRTSNSLVARDWSCSALLGSAWLGLLFRP